MKFNACVYIPMSRYENERNSESEESHVRDKLKTLLILDAQELLCDGELHSVRYVEPISFYHKGHDARRYGAKLIVDEPLEREEQSYERKV